MTTITIKINEKSSLGRVIIELLKSSAKESKAVEFLEQESPYNPDFVKKIKQARQEIKEGKTVRINPDDVWGSLGLK